MEHRYLYLRKKEKLNQRHLTLLLLTGWPNAFVLFQIIDKISIDHASQQLPQFHQTFLGLTNEQAELEFIKEAQKLQEYGIHFYKVQRKLAHAGSGKVKDVFSIMLRK